jgi:hypothetical protein
MLTGMSDILKILRIQQLIAMMAGETPHFLKHKVVSQNARRLPLTHESR